MAISIVVADDHPVVRRGMRALLESQPDFSIAGAAADGLEAVRLTEREIAINAYIEQSKTGSFDPHETLTPRQREVLQLAAEGKTNAEIAERLNISQRTVENHRASLMQRLGLRNQTQLIRHAMSRGLIPPHE
jgi:DNA-binding NarL/FixJ family response regulator